MTQNDPTQTAPHPAPPRGVRHKVRHHVNRAREAWKRYYHYQRLEQHGSPLPWHGLRGWTRMIVTGLILAAIIAYGLHRTL